MQILDKLDFDSFVSLSQTNRQFADLARLSFKRKFENKTICIEAPFHLELDDQLTEIYETDRITINSEQASLILKKFGSEISKLDIFYERIEADRAMTITKELNEYCAETITELFLSGIRQNTWPLLRKPFANVETVTFNGQLEVTEADNLNDIFPNLRRLNLNYVLTSKSFGLNQTFPHLEHLQVKFVNLAGFQEKEATALLKSNPQLRRLSIRRATPKFLRTINELLPNLNELELLQMARRLPRPMANAQIRFENVKKLSVVSGPYCMIQNLIFTQLEEFTLDCIPMGKLSMDNAWIGYIEKLGNMKKLHFIGDVTNEQVRALNGMLPNLMEFSIAGVSDIQIETIKSFIERHEKMTKFHFNVFYDALDIEELKRTLESYWEIVDEQSGEFRSIKMLRIE